MSISKIKTMVVVLTAAVAISAQTNARMDALSGAPMTDISDVFSYPVLMTGYTGHVQATWGNWIIGIKSLNDMVSVGLMANTGLMSDLDRAISSLYGAVPPGFPDPYSHIPHLLLGFDLGDLKMGASVFFEYTRAKRTSKVEVTGPASATEDELQSAFIMHPGLRLSAEYDLGDIGILGKVGVGFPYVSDRAKGTYTGTGAQANYDEKVTSRGCLFMEMGAEVAMPLMDGDWTFGAEYNFTTIDANSSGRKEPWTNSALAVYVGGEYNVLETAAVAFGYTFVRGAETYHPEDIVTDASRTFTKSTGATHTHIFAAGVENIWDEAWIFDSFALRVGANYAITNNREADNGEVSITGGSTTKTRERFKDWTRFSAVNPTIGFGVSKSFLTLDLSLNPAAWGAVLTGPPVAMVTGTVKF